jgi:transcriptional regulator with XRE-family HTH domain
MKMDQRRQIFAQRLRILRKNKGFTQKELGKLLSVTDAAVGMWEQARRLPVPEMLIHLAEVFDVSVDWLLGRVMQNKNCELDEFLNSLNHKHSEKSKEILAAHRSDDPTQELPEEARRSLEEFKEYILKKYSKK